MKKVTRPFFAVLLALAITRPANAQIGAVSAPILEAMTQAQHLERMIYTIQQTQQMIQNVTNSYNQLQNMLRAEQRALANLKGASNISSWDDFMTWYNRQLYLERQAEQRFNNMGIKVGNKTYSMTNIQGIKEGIQTQYKDIWEGEFSEAQRKEMWTNLGLAPSNYVYLKTWQAREEALGKLILTRMETLNEENMKAAERKKAINDRLAEDSSLPEDQKMGEKEIAQYNLEMTMDTNMVLRNMAQQDAERNAYEQAQQTAAATPPPPPRLSDGYNASIFPAVTD